jgi:L-threonylcarbamoyladenylate synthase
MIEPPSQPEWIDLAQADDRRDVVHRAVACLAQGGVVGLATETVYGLAASALHPEAVARLAREGRDAGAAPESMLLVRDPVEVEDWVPNLSELGWRLARRAWPGPMTLLFPDPGPGGLARRLHPSVRTALFPEGAVALRSPDHPFLREVLRLLPAPLAFSKAGAPGSGFAATADALAKTPGLSMIVDEGPTLLGGASTVVKVEGDRWSIVRPGFFDAATVTRMAGTILLFVCTGNTCRSPMAEALCKVLLARRLGCGLDELEGRGYVVLSAGMAALNGMPAASHAIDVVHARGGSLSEHSSRKLTADLVRAADVIIAMTNDHLESLLDQAPECSPRARLLHPHGDDVADPVGCDRETYVRTARAIEEYLDHLLGELGV